MIQWRPSSPALTTTTMTCLPPFSPIGQRQFPPAVVSGEYASTSEVIRDALRDWTLKRKVATMELDEMRRLVREGIESVPGVDADLVFARLGAKYAGATEE
jgi:antitoxin ParD1/3/4